MGAVELDRLSIEKRDFPVVRRGYEPAAVDAHLRAVAGAAAELSSQARRGESVGAAAASQVQVILDAAEAASAQIVGDAQRQAAGTIQEAQLAAQQTRSEAIAAAQAHIAAVAQATAALRSRVEAMDVELHGLAETLRGATGKLAQDLGAVERDMAALYDAASGRRATEGDVAPASIPAPVPASALLAEAEPPTAPAPAIASASSASAPADLPVTPVSEAAEAHAGETYEPPAGTSETRAADVDGARLIALNMALNGDSREETDRYLEQHFDLPQREKLIDEVYAAVEG